MILPTKHLPVDRALLSIGRKIILLLDQPRTVSALWDAVRAGSNLNRSAISYPWFVLALDLLCIIKVVDLQDGLVRRVER
jgi:hypothetical protein